MKPYKRIVWLYRFVAPNSGRALFSNRAARDDHSKSFCR